VPPVRLFTDPLQVVNKTQTRASDTRRSHVKEENMTCAHPPKRLYAWTAYDGELAVCCCDCGAVLQGADEDDEEGRANGAS
jgi:hypothetical protein